MILGPMQCMFVVWVCSVHMSVHLRFVFDDDLLIIKLIQIPVLSQSLKRNVSILSKDINYRTIQFLQI